MDEHRKREFEMYYEALKSGDPDAYPKVFAYIRKRLEGNVGQPILVSRDDKLAMSLGILRNKAPLYRTLELGFHTGPVAKYWKGDVDDIEGPLWVGHGSTMMYVVETIGDIGAFTSPPPIIRIGREEIRNFVDPSQFEAIDRMIELASVADADIYGRSKEREKLAERIRAVDKLYEPTFGCGPDEIDNPLHYEAVGQMALCIRRAKQLEYEHPLLTTFENYLKP